MNETILYLDNKKHFKYQLSDTIRYDCYIYGFEKKQLYCANVFAKKENILTFFSYQYTYVCKCLKKEVNNSIFTYDPS